MTKKEREKAINLLDNLIGMIDDNQGNDYDFALKMGIKALRMVDKTETGKMLICPECGLDVHSDYKTCPRCGARIGSEVEK